VDKDIPLASLGIFDNSMFVLSQPYHQSISLFFVCLITYLKFNATIKDGEVRGNMPKNAKIAN